MHDSPRTGIKWPFDPANPGPPSFPALEIALAFAAGIVYFGSLLAAMYLVYAL